MKSGRFGSELCRSRLFCRREIIERCWFLSRNGYPRLSVFCLSVIGNVVSLRSCTSALEVAKPTWKNGGRRPSQRPSARRPSRKFRNMVRFSSNENHRTGKCRGKTDWPADPHRPGNFPFDFHLTTQTEVWVDEVDVFSHSLKVFSLNQQHFNQIDEEKCWVIWHPTLRAYFSQHLPQSDYDSI